MESNPFDFKELMQHFQFSGEFVNAEPYGHGHINDTFVAQYDSGKPNHHRYIIQRINHNIFKNPPQLMENIWNVTGFIRSKITAAGGDPDRSTLTVIPASDEKHYYRDPQGNYWRAYVFIEGAQTYQVVENAEHLYHAGKALGRFQKYLSGYPASALHETIPDFHDTGKRFEAFLEAVEKNAAGRAEMAKNEIDFVMERSKNTTALTALIETGDLPLRVTHNDTKFNNVMIDDITGEGICLIDLDTVMPGLALYDFGDSIRSGANPAEEDERDLSKVSMDLTLYESFTRGYLEESREFLLPMEVDLLPFSAKLMTFECGMRFLADHLNGDTYFKVHRENHNLDRARTQFKMVADMEEKMDRMREIVRKYTV